LPMAMRAVGYSDEETQNRTLQMQVRRAMDKLNGGGNVNGRPASASEVAVAASAMMTLATGVTNEGGAVGTNTADNEIISPLKKVRKTSHRVQIERQNQKKIKDIQGRAHRRATYLVAIERMKEVGNRLTTIQVIDLVVAEFKKSNPTYTVSLSKSTINRYIQLGMQGEFPLMRGREGIVPKADFHLLVHAVESFIQINQVNSNVVHRKVLMALINAVCGIESLGEEKKTMLERVLRSTYVKLDATYALQVEEPRLRWLTRSNLELWGNGWKVFLVEMGFATRDASSGKVFIPDDQLSRIGNVDESRVSLDSSNTSAGGRPCLTFTDPNLPLVKQSNSKSNLGATVICGSTAGGECFPIHWQLMTSAKDDQRRKFKHDFLRFQQNTFGKFGTPERRTWPCTIGMNEKGGMNDKEFRNYVMNTILPMYPDMEDMPGKRVLLKIDSGPGRYDTELILWARSMGLYLFVGVPNCTAVQQETDQNYGPFKSVVRANLTLISDKAFAEQKNCPLTISTFCLITYGGECPDTKVACKNAVAAAFDLKSNLSAWNKVGAVGTDEETGRRCVTMECIKSKKVRVDGTDVSDPNYSIYQEIQSKNDYATTQLSMRGFMGHLLKVQFKEDEIRARQEALLVTDPQSDARREAMRNASTAGARFFAYGGSGHVTSDDVIANINMNNLQPMIAALEKEKKLRTEYHLKLAAAQPILERLENVLSNNTDRLNGGDLAVLLKWKGIAASKMGNLDAKRRMYRDILEKESEDENLPPSPLPWTEEEEEALENLKNSNVGDISTADTASARFAARQKKEALNTLKKMSPEEREAFLQSIDEADAEDEQETD